MPKERFGKSPLRYCRHCGAPPHNHCQEHNPQCDIETAEEARDRVARVIEAESKNR